MFALIYVSVACLGNTQHLRLCQLDLKKFGFHLLQLKFPHASLESTPLAVIRHVLFVTGRRGEKKVHCRLSLYTTVWRDTQHVWLGAVFRYHDQWAVLRQPLSRSELLCLRGWQSCKTNLLAPNTDCIACCAVVCALSGVARPITITDAGCYQQAALQHSYTVRCEPILHIYIMQQNIRERKHVGRRTRALPCTLRLHAAESLSHD